MHWLFGADHMRGFLASPTINAWIALMVRMGSQIILLPFVLRVLSANDATVWLLFASIGSFLMLVDLGFTQTFARFVAFSLSESGKQGAMSVSDLSQKTVPLSLLNVAMGKVYFRLAVIGLVLTGLVGTYSVAAPIENSTAVADSWLAWMIILLGTVTNLYGNRYVALLTGANQIVALKRIESTVSLLALVSQGTVLFFSSSLSLLVLSGQLWSLMGLLQNMYTAKRLGLLVSFSGDEDSVWPVLGRIWEVAWRSGVGLLLGFGVIQGATIYLANVLPPAGAAALLFSYRLAQVIVQISMVPFYSILPTLNALRHKGDIVELGKIGLTGLSRGLAVFIIFFGFVGVLVPSSLVIIGSKTAFPTGVFWSILLLGMMLERYGGMHMQLYSTTNHIIWHKIHVVSGAIFVFLLATLTPLFGMTAFAIAYVGANLLCYMPWAVYRSYQVLPEGYHTRELRKLTPHAVAAIFVFCVLLLMDYYMVHDALQHKILDCLNGSGLHR